MTSGASEDEHMAFTEFIVHDRLGPLTVTGQLLADQRFGSNKPRWTDMALYEVFETVRNRRVTASCQGCRPARSLMISETTLHGAQVLCGACKRPFILDESQEERPFRYLLEITARSWVYHDVNGSCTKSRHTIQAVGEVKKNPTRWNNLVSCTRCDPPELEDMRNGDRIAQERSDSHLYLCADASDIVNRLYHRSGELSGLAASLLRKAAREDPDIASAWKKNRRI